MSDYTSGLDHLREKIDDLLIFAPHAVCGTHVQMLVDRDKNNTNKSSKRWVKKLISTDERCFLKNIETLYDTLYGLDSGDIRLYSTINPSINEKAASSFISNMVENSINLPTPFGWSKIFDVQNNLISLLCNPENCKRIYYLIDDDIHNKPRENYFQNHNVLFHYPTKRGYHYIVMPFDVRMYENINGVEVHKYGLMLLDWRLKNE